MKKWGKLLLGGLMISFALTVSAAGMEMSHWAQVRDESGEIIGRVEKGEVVNIIGQSTDNPTRTEIYCPGSGLTGSVASVYLYGGTDYEYENPGEYVYKGTQKTASEEGLDEESYNEDSIDEEADSQAEKTGSQDGSGYESTNLWIDINIADQTITVYSDDTAVLYEPCVTGTEGQRDTPTGEFTILDKVESAVLSGGGEEDGYCTSVQYWMPITEYGIGIHDAIWRNGDFGGDNYLTDGSHGCINVDFDVAAAIFDMVDVGTPVYIHY